MLSPQDRWRHVSRMWSTLLHIVDLEVKALIVFKLSTQLQSCEFLFIYVPLEVNKQTQLLFLQLKPSSTSVKEPLLLPFKESRIITYLHMQDIRIYDIE